MTSVSRGRSSACALSAIPPERKNNAARNANRAMVESVNFRNEVMRVRVTDIIARPVTPMTYKGKGLKKLGAPSHGSVGAARLSSPKSSPYQLNSTQRNELRRIRNVKVVVAGSKADLSGSRENAIRLPYGDFFCRTARFHGNRKVRCLHDG